MSEQPETTGQVLTPAQATAEAQTPAPPTATPTAPEPTLEGRLMSLVAGLELRILALEHRHTGTTH